MEIERSVQIGKLVGNWVQWSWDKSFGPCMYVCTLLQLPRNREWKRLVDRRILLKTYEWGVVGIHTLTHVYKHVHTHTNTRLSRLETYTPTHVKHPWVHTRHGPLPSSKDTSSLRHTPYTSRPTLGWFSCPILLPHDLVLGSKDGSCVDQCAETCREINT